MAANKLPSLDWIPFSVAARAWGISRNTIAWAYWTERLHMVKVDTLWLVYWPDMITQFGNPRQPITIEPSEYSGQG